MALVYEDTASDWQGGFARGQAAGYRARGHATAIGFPADRPIYMAVDRDVVTEAQFRTMVEYLRGAGTSLGGSRLTGVYGEHDVCLRAQQAGVAAWYWQATAWSHHELFAGRHLFQKVMTVKVNGFDCDVNDVLQADWGQHNANHAHIQEDDMAITVDEWKKITAIAEKAAGDAAKQNAKFVTGAGGSGVFNPTIKGNEWMRTAPTVGKALAAVKGIDVDEAAIAATVLAGLNPAVIAAAIPEDIAKDVADLLAARLAG